jgi:hypothetical protein
VQHLEQQLLVQVGVNVTVTAVTADTSLNLTNVSNGTCSRPLSATSTVTVNALPVATLSSNSPICSGADAIFTITGTGRNTVNYTGAASGTATIGAGGTVNVTVSAVTANTSLNLTNVSNGTCSRPLTATSTVTVNALPVAATLVLIVRFVLVLMLFYYNWNGSTVNYTGAASGTATIGAGGTVDVTVTAVTADTTLNLTSVSNGTCSRPLSLQLQL